MCHLCIALCVHHSLYLVSSSGVFYPENWGFLSKGREAAPSRGSSFSRFRLSCSQPELLLRKPHVSFLCGIFWSLCLGCKSVFRLHGRQTSTGTHPLSPRTGVCMHRDAFLCDPGSSPEARMFVTTGQQEIVLALSFDPLSCPYCSIAKKNKS